MSKPKPRFMFAGHAIGASAQFDKLDDAKNLNHIIPTLGASVLPVTGGRSHAHVEPYRFDVKSPRKRCLLAVDRIDTWVEGRSRSGRHETELSIEIAGLHVVEQLHFELVRLHIHSARRATGNPVVKTN